MPQLLIKNARVFTNNQLIVADVLCRDGKIAAIGSDLSGFCHNAQIFDAKHKLLAPGLIDVHVHFRDPGFTHKETLTTGAKSAAAGGYTTVFAMPNLNPVPDTPEKIATQVRRNASECCVHVLQYAAMTKGRLSDEIVDVPACIKAGAAAFSNDGNGVQTANTMYQAMKACAANNVIYAAHVEDDSLAAGGVINLGNTSQKLNLPGINNVSESAQLARDLMLAQATGVHYHVCHISTKESVALIRWAKQQGINVTCEVSPHHLLLNDGDIVPEDSNYKMNPPLRSAADQQALIAGLKDGTIDMIATDHAPHAQAEKTGDLVHAAFGITGLETSFDMLYQRLVKPGTISLATLINKMACVPAAKFGLADRGEIMVGKNADMCLIDLDCSRKITNAFASMGQNTPFVGQEVSSQVVATIVAGKVVMERK